MPTIATHPLLARAATTSGRSMHRHLTGSAARDASPALGDLRRGRAVAQTSLGFDRSGAVLVHPTAAPLGAGYSVVRRPALAGIIGGRRAWTVSMISELSMPWR